MERVGASAFEGTRLPRDGTWAVVFLADWCGFCREFVPDFEALPLGAAHGLAVDISDLGNPLWELFEIDIVPTVLVFHERMQLARVDGVSGVGIDSRGLRRIEEILARIPSTLPGKPPRTSRRRPSGG